MVILPGLIRSFTVKENHIGSSFWEILCCRQKKLITFYDRICKTCFLDNVILVYLGHRGEGGCQVLGWEVLQEERIYQGVGWWLCRSCCHERYRQVILCSICQEVYLSILLKMHLCILKIKRVPKLFHY